jgi:glycosyltransferase involved in cell wall biosynthesis
VPLPISVVVPARNAERWVVSCLEALRASDPDEIIVVDGASTDGTARLAAPLADTIVDDHGTGIAAGRQLGLRLARNPWVAFVDTDVLVAPDTLRRLLDEATERGLEGIQAGLHSVGEGDYWSEALATHHNTGHVRRWFGVCATLVRRELLVRHPFDETLRSGEDVDLRLRLELAGEPIGVSEGTVVEHRFAGGYAYARDQWLADGAGLGRLIRRHGARAVPRALLPFAAAGLGLLRLLAGDARLVPYWIGLALGNFFGLIDGLADRRVPIGRPSYESERRAEAGSVRVRTVAFTLGASLVGSLLGILLTVSGIARGLGSSVRTSPFPVVLTVLVAFGLVVAEVGLSLADARARRMCSRAMPILLGAAAVAIVLGGLRFAYIVGLLA